MTPHKQILLAITGGIAAYKSCELVRLLKKAGHEVTVAMSHSATEFIHPNTFQALSGNPVLLDTHGSSGGNGMAHINLTREADVMLIAPASANTIAKSRTASPTISSAIWSPPAPALWSLPQQ